MSSSTPPPSNGGQQPSSRSGILPSNVGTTDDEAKVARRGFPMAWSLVVLVVFVAGAAAIVLYSGTQGNVPRRTSPATPISRSPATLAAPDATGAQASGPAPINGISCDALESTIFHVHVHLAVFVDGQEEFVPYGVGVAPPWQVANSARGPFVEDGTCFYWLHTHTGDGVIHVEAPVRRRFTLGDFFAIWQVPLSADQVGSARGQVISYVNGRRDDTNPPDIPLTSHERIQLNVGQDVPPQPFDFAPGD